MALTLWQIVYSPTLRTHDVGTVVVGSPPTTTSFDQISSLIIPPGRPEYDFIGYCPSACVNRLFPPQDPINIIYTTLHMHTLGRGGEIQVSQLLECCQKLRYG